MRLAQEKIVHSASVRCANRVKTLIKLLIKSKLRLDPNKKASGVEILQNLRKKSQERIAKFPEFWRAKRTEFNFFSGKRALRKSYGVTEALD